MIDLSEYFRTVKINLSFYLYKMKKVFFLKPNVFFFCLFCTNNNDICNYSFQIIVMKNRLKVYRIISQIHINEYISIYLIKSKLNLNHTRRFGFITRQFKISKYLFNLLCKTLFIFLHLLNCFNYFHKHIHCNKKNL